VGVRGGEHGNIQTGGGYGECNKPTGCSTSVVLATGPTDEEEEEVKHNYEYIIAKELHSYSVS